MKYISIKSIYSRIPLTERHMDSDLIGEYASHALNLLKIRQAYKQNTCILNIKDYTADLPKTYSYIEAVAYMHTNLPQSEIDKIISLSKDVTKTDDGTYKTTTTTITQLETTGSTYDNERHIDRIQYQGVLNNYKLWVDEPLFQNNFIYLSVTNKPYTSKFLCNYCPNLQSNCTLYYSINPYGQIITPQIKTGILCVSYLDKIKDSSGALMIPDLEEVKQAIASYIMQKYYEDKLIDTPDKITYQLHNDYLIKTEKLMAKCRGNMLLQETDPEELVKIQERYLNFVKHQKVFN